MSFSLSARDRARLAGVHPDLAAVVERAAGLCPKVFIVVEGCRTLEQQRRNVAKGVSKTLKSRHIPAANGVGHAVDLMIAETGGDRDWDDDNPNWKLIATAMKSAAAELGTPIEWGGDWKSFVDTPHWQLPWGAYPGSKPLAKSRTVAGAASAGGFGLLAEPVSEAAQQIQPLADYSQVIKWLFIGLMVPRPVIGSLGAFGAGKPASGAPLTVGLRSGEHADVIGYSTMPELKVVPAGAGFGSRLSLGGWGSSLNLLTIDYSGSYDVTITNHGTVAMGQAYADKHWYVQAGLRLGGASGKLLASGTAAPTTGTYAVGDRVLNSAPAVGSPKSWVCTVAGTPGTWVSEGNL